MEKKQEFNKLSLKAPFLIVDFNPVKKHLAEQQIWFKQAYADLYCSAVANGKGLAKNWNLKLVSRNQS